MANTNVAIVLAGQMHLCWYLSGRLLAAGFNLDWTRHKILQVICTLPGKGAQYVSDNTELAHQVGGVVVWQAKDEQRPCTCWSRISL